MKILFIGDIFGEPGIKAVERKLKEYIKNNSVDFVIAQCENVSGRKGLTPKDYNRLKSSGIDVLTMGNHVWAKESIKNIINQKDIIRPFNINKGYQGHGTEVFDLKDKKIRVTSMLGYEFNDLRTGWNEKRCNNFFDAYDDIENNYEKTDLHIIDFHGEVTSEKNVFGLYLDGKVTALFGTHTHVQTSDAKILPNGTAYITDAGSTGPINSAIGADYKTVYEKMRFNNFSRFKVSSNPVEMNGVLLEILDNKMKIKSIKQMW